MKRKLMFNGSPFGWIGFKQKPGRKTEDLPPKVWTNKTSQQKDTKRTWWSLWNPFDPFVCTFPATLKWKGFYHMILRNMDEHAVSWAFLKFVFFLFFFWGGASFSILFSRYLCFFVTSKSQGAHCFVHSLWFGTCTSHRLVSEPGAVGIFVSQIMGSSVFFLRTTFTLDVVLKVTFVMVLLLLLSSVCCLFSKVKHVQLNCWTSPIYSIINFAKE